LSLFSIIAGNDSRLAAGGDLKAVACPTAPKLIKRTKLSNFTAAPLAASLAVTCWPS